jgi:hypothetical protein
MSSSMSSANFNPANSSIDPNVIIDGLAGDTSVLKVLAEIPEGGKISWTGQGDTIYVEGKVAALRAVSNLWSRASSILGGGSLEASAQNIPGVLQKKIDKLDQDLKEAFTALDQAEQKRDFTVKRQLVSLIATIEDQIKDAKIGLANLARTYEVGEKKIEAVQVIMDFVQRLEGTFQLIQKDCPVKKKEREEALPIERREIGIKDFQDLGSSSSSSSAHPRVREVQPSDDSRALLAESLFTAPREILDENLLELVPEELAGISKRLSASAESSATPKEFGPIGNIYSLMTEIFNNPNTFPDDKVVRYVGRELSIPSAVAPASSRDRTAFTDHLAEAFGKVGIEVVSELGNSGNLTVADMKAAFLRVAARVTTEDLRGLFDLIKEQGTNRPSLDVCYAQCWTNLSSADRAQIMRVSDFENLTSSQIAILLKPFRYVPLRVEENLRYYPTVDAVFHQDPAQRSAAISSVCSADGEFLRALAFADQLMCLQSEDTTTNSKSPFESGLQYVLAASEHIGKRICYHDLRAGMIIPCENEVGDEFFYTVKAEITDTPGGFFNYIMAPTTNADQQILDPAVAQDVRLVYRGSNTPAAWKRNLDTAGVGKKKFDDHAGQVLANLERVLRVLESSPNGVRLSIDGHSLGACDTQRGLVMVLKAIADAQDNPNSPFHKIKKIVMTAHNAPRPEEGLNDELYRVLNRIQAGKTAAPATIRPDFEIDLNYVIYRDTEGAEDVVQTLGTEGAKHIGYGVSNDLDCFNRCPFMKRRCIRVIIPPLGYEIKERAKGIMDRFNLLSAAQGFNPDILYMHSSKVFTDSGVGCKVYPEFGRDERGAPTATQRSGIEVFEGDRAIAETNSGARMDPKDQTWAGYAQTFAQPVFTWCICCSPTYCSCDGRRRSRGGGGEPKHYARTAQ